MVDRSTHSGNEALGSGPLIGVRVLEACAYVAGPLSAGLLADMGAEVIKVEPPNGVGDVSRFFGAIKHLKTTGEPLGSMFHIANRGKKSITLNLKHESGQAVLADLVRSVDCFIQNYRPGVAEKLGLDWPTLRQINPHLIMVSVSGFGQTGPYKDKPVFEPVVQARSGIASLNRDVDGNPSLVRGTLMLDKITPQVVSRSVCAALFARERHVDKLGQHIEVSMLDTGLEFAWPDGMVNNTFLDDEGNPVGGAGQIANSFCTLATRDGGVAIPTQMLPQLAKLCAPEVLQDPSIKTYSQLAHKLGRALVDSESSMTTLQMCELLEGYGIMCAPVVDENNVQNCPQVQHMETVLERHVEHVGRVREARHAALFRGTPITLAPRGAPLLGEHTREVLAAIGYDAKKIEALQDAGIFGREMPGPDGESSTRSIHARL